MLSNPTNNLHNRQRQHRRQQSTPHAFEPVKAQNLPNIQRHGLHRRGMSLDQRRRQTPPQDINVSITNQGYQTTPQHILRETQQQRLVRPGHQSANFDKDENYLNSPTVSPHRQSFDASCGNQYQDRGHQYSYSGPVNTIVNVDLNNYNGSNDFNLFPADGSLTPSAFLDFSASFGSSQGSSNGNHSRRQSAGRRISGGIVDRVAQFENMALQSPQTQRPITPPHQNVSSYFPPTPVDTPHDRMVKHEPINRRFLDDYDTSMEETIKPKSNQRARGVFDDMRKQAETQNPTPPNSQSMTSSASFDSAPMPTANFMNMSNLNLQFMKQETQYDLQYSPSNTALSAYNSSPSTTQSAVFTDPFTSKPDLNYPEPTIPSSPSTQYRRSESISSINMDETFTSTGITIDDIASFIKGPDPTDSKWICLYPSCNKRFGRKENIKSHVQTHLGDRQFQCPHCKKCFVRQHDLKRHAKIHSGDKPFKCQCGNSFARHDALTRHRQRGMCIGALEGIVRKTVKRGRPRKNRPDNEERLKKSSKTRSKNKDKTTSSASSTTGYSESNASGSPRSDLDLDILDEYTYSQSSNLNHGSFEYSSQPYSPSMENNNDYVSPQQTQQHPPASPSSYSQSSSTHTHSQNGSFSSTSNQQLPTHPSSPAHQSQQEQDYHSPPGLCESFSSPAPSPKFHDMELEIEKKGNGSSRGMGLGLGDIAEQDDDADEMFLEAFAAAVGRDGGCEMGMGMGMSMSQLERDPGLLLKFEDEELFRNEEDVFFGSP